MTRMTLIRTSPPLPPGSMTICASLLEEALGDGSSVGMQIRTCNFFDPAGGSMQSHHLWRLRHASSFFTQHPSDRYHLIDGSMAAFLPRDVLEKTVVTVHDLIPLLQMQRRLPGRPGPAGRWVIGRSLRALRNAAGLAAVSGHTRRDLSEQTGRDDIVVIPHPVRRLEENPVPACADLPERYLFHVGNNAVYKNRSGVLDVFARLQDLPDLHLILAGPPPTRDLKRISERLSRVRFEINPSDNQLSVLYKKASAFLFPSLYEGFGMPVLEAMAAGCPVVCSSAASLPEVAGEAAWFAPAGNGELLAQHCRTLLEDSARREDLILKGRKQAAQFTKERFAGDVQMWYRSTGSRKKGGV